MNIDKLNSHWNGLSEITPLKSGGQKDVFRAQSDDYGTIAIKIYKNFDARAEREISIMQRINRSGIPRIFDYHCFDDIPCVSMVVLEEFIEGNSLRDYLLEGNRYGVEQTIHLLHFLLEEVVFLDSQAIVHRDIKPDNIICSRDGTFHLIDFGIARDLSQASLTATGPIGPCTPGYAPPEQFKNMKALITSKTDLFAIGVVAYEMLTGRNPYVEKNDSLFDILSKTGTMPTPMLPLLDKYSRDLFAFIRILMAKQAYKRPISVNQAYEWFLRICEYREKDIEADRAASEDEIKLGDYLE